MHTGPGRHHRRDHRPPEQWKRVFRRATVQAGSAPIAVTRAAKRSERRACRLHEGGRELFDTQPPSKTVCREASWPLPVGPDPSPLPRPRPLKLQLPERAQLPLPRATSLDSSPALPTLPRTSAAQSHAAVQRPVPSLIPGGDCYFPPGMDTTGHRPAPAGLPLLQTRGGSVSLTSRYPRGRKERILLLLAPSVILLAQNKGRGARTSDKQQGKGLLPRPCGTSRAVLKRPWDRPRSQPHV